MTHIIIHNQIIHKRLALILQLIKEGRDIARIERETAFLVLDTIDGITTKEIPLKEGCHCFTQIEYALDQKIRNRFSKEFEDMINEGLLLDEINTKYGPDIELLVGLATKMIIRRKLRKKIVKDRISSVIT